MASAQDLLGLMSQLQRMEASVTLILMEAAMKLSALTDADVFLLVETQQERRFAGRRRLCEAFVADGLRAAAGDVECSVDAGVSAIRQRTLDPSALRSDRTTGRNDASSTPPWPGSAGRTGVVRKRPFAGRPSYPTPSKLSKPTAGDSPLVVEEDTKFSVAPEDETASNLVVEDVRQLGADFPPTIDDDDVIALNDVFNHKPSVEESWNDVDPDAGGLEAFAVGGAGACVPYNGVTAAAASGVANPPLDCIGDVYPESLLGKLQALDAFDVETIFDPSAAPRKILNSILHEVGSKLAVACPFWPRQLANPRLKEFLIANVEAFVARFPVMRRICGNKDKVYIGKKSMSKLTYVKNNIRSSYDKVFK